MVLCLDLAWLELSNPPTGSGNTPSQGSQASSSVIAEHPTSVTESTSDTVTNNDTMNTTEVAPGINEASTSASTSALLNSESSASNPKPSKTHHSEPMPMDTADESIIELSNTEQLSTNIQPSTSSTALHSAHTDFKPSQRTPKKHVALACLVPDDSTDTEPLASTSNTPARTLTKTPKRTLIRPTRIKAEFKQEVTELATTTVEEIRLVKHLGPCVNVSKDEDDEEPSRANQIPNASVTNNVDHPTTNEDHQNNVDQPVPEGEDIPHEPQNDNGNTDEESNEDNNPQQESDSENEENSNSGEDSDSGSESDDYRQVPTSWPRRAPTTIEERDFFVRYLRTTYGENTPIGGCVRMARPVLESDDEDDEDDEYVESQGDGYQVKEGEVTAKRIMPKWLTRDPFDNRLWNFEISRFPIVRYAGHLKNWLEGTATLDRWGYIHNCEWAYFSARVAELMSKYKEVLSGYYKNGMSPNDRRQLCATVAWYFPLLGKRYNEYRELKADGEEIGSKTTFSFRTITELLYKRLEYQFRYRNSWQRRYGPEKVIKKRGTSLATIERNRKRRRANPEEEPEVPTEQANTTEPDASANDDSTSSLDRSSEEAINAVNDGDSSSSDTLLNEENGPMEVAVSTHDTTNPSDSNKNDSSNDVHNEEPTASASGSSSTSTEHINNPPTDVILNDQPQEDVVIISDNESNSIVPLEDNVITIDDSPNPPRLNDP